MVFFLCSVSNVCSFFWSWVILRHMDWVEILGTFMNKICMFITVLVLLIKLSMVGHKILMKHEI